MNSTVQLLFQADADVGEGPIWDKRRNELIFVDVTGGKLHFVELSDDVKVLSAESYKLETHLGAVALIQDSEDSYLLAIRDGFAVFERKSNSLKLLNRILFDDEIRFNDGKVDNWGRFVAGTMRYKPEPGTAKLYRFYGDNRSEVLLESIGLSNGIAFYPQSEFMYYIDSLSQNLVRFRYCENGRLLQASTIFEFPYEMGTPDGMTIDQEGCLWVALWGGSAVVRVSPEGRLLKRIDLPVSQVTSCVFGGPENKYLFITTARHNLMADQLEREPLAGSLFVAEVEVAGFAENHFLMPLG